jgi:hypothetical protein
MLLNYYPADAEFFEFAEFAEFYMVDPDCRLISAATSLLDACQNLSGSVPIMK